MATFNRRTEGRLRRVLGWLVVAAIGAAACGQAETSAQTGGSSPASDSPSSVPQSAVTPGAPPLVLEFEVPAGFTDGSAAVTGFRVGFFRANDSTAITTVDVSRETVTVRGQTARLTVARENVPPCGGDCVVRVQALSRAQASVWSDPVPLSGTVVRETRIRPERPQPPQQPRVARPARQRTASRPARLTSDEVQKHAQLSGLLRKLLPPDANVDAEVRPFQNLQQVALAAVLSRDYDIPFTTLGKAMEGPPRTTFREALMTLRKDLDVPGAIRKSRRESLRLLEMPETNPNAP